ncbi:response regulator transcription factor [Serratia ureilytica]|uniref:response regulator transcription factor n=1 Tax=Serratia ureilytica TaxID=300181 RepID=UPI00214DF901|nr:LuxR C-terminal-related transcriptional regulator [Serratia ureilytica]UUW17351.1 LuxR C-terminal-related transcriptional regulator [Serratia ureilytica]
MLSIEATSTTLILKGRIKMEIKTPAINTSSEKKEKRVVIFDSCQFTIRGLTLLCERHADWRMCGTANSFSQLRKLLAQDRIDMVLCGIGNQLSDFSRLLNLPEYPIARCILLTDKSSAVLRKTFLTAGFDAVVSKQTSINALDNLLHYQMHRPCGKANTSDTVGLYQPQERDVLSALLNGQKPDAIAQEMGISYRTVSRYKQNGLKRAGLRSLNEILARQKNYLSV